MVNYITPTEEEISNTYYLGDVNESFEVSSDIDIANYATIEQVEKHSNKVTAEHMHAYDASHGVDIYDCLRSTWPFLFKVDGTYTYRPNEKMTKAELVDFIAEKADLTKKYGHLYKFVRSWDVGLEIFDIKSGKGECIDYIKKYKKRE